MDFNAKSNSIKKARSNWKKLRAQFNGFPICRKQLHIKNGEVASATLAAAGSVSHSVIKKLSRRFHLEVKERHDKECFLSN